MRSTIRTWTVRSALLLATATPTFALAGEAQPIGRITAAFGSGTIVSNEQTRSADLHALINNDELITTGAGGVSVLLTSRVVLKIDAHSSVRVWESTGQTNILVEYGTVHVFVGRRAVENGFVAVHDGNGRIETTTAVFLASYDPTTRKSYYACEENVIRVEPRQQGAEPITLAVEQQVTLVDGAVATPVAAIDRAQFFEHKQALERLGQVATQQGAEVFRLRSRTQDLKGAIQSLSASGWIDPATLAADVPNQTVATAGGISNSAARGEQGGGIASGRPAKASGLSPSAPAAGTRSPASRAPAAPAAPATATPPAEDALALPAQADISLPINDPPPSMDVIVDTKPTAPPAADVAREAVPPVDMPAVATPPVDRPVEVAQPPAPDIVAPVDIDVGVNLPPVEAAVVRPVDVAPPPGADIGITPAEPMVPIDVAVKPPIDVDVKPPVDVAPPAATPPADVIVAKPPVDVAVRNPRKPVVEPPVEVPVVAPPVADIGIALPIDKGTVLPKPVDIGITPPIDPGTVAPPVAIKPPVDIKPPAVSGVVKPPVTVPPPTDIGVKPPADIGIKPPVDIAPPPTDIGVKPPVDVAPPPPTDIGIKPPVDVAPPPPTDIGIKPPVDVAPPPPTDIGVTPPVDVSPTVPPVEPITPPPAVDLPPAPPAAPTPPVKVPDVTPPPTEP